MGALFRRFWLPILLQSELPEPDCPPLRVRLLGEDLVAFRDSTGQVGFLAENCPHRGASLFFGRNEEAGLRCVYHGWKFDTTGTCLDMPNEPAESDFKHKVKATAYPGAEHGGVIWCYMGPSHLEPELPQLEWTRVPPSHRWLGKTYIEANYLNPLEGTQDPTHSSFLHRWFAPETMPNRRNFDHAAYVKDTAPKIAIQEMLHGQALGVRRDRGDGSYHWRVTHWLAPSYHMIAPPSWPHIGSVWVPIDDEHCFQMVNFYHPERPLTDEERAFYESGTTNTPLKIPGTFKPIPNKSNDYLIDRQLQRTRNYTGITGSGTEDYAMAESMGPIMDRTKEHLGTADVGIILRRRALLRMARDLQRGIEPYQATHGEVYGIRALCVNDPEPSFASLVEQYREELQAHVPVQAKAHN
jgi:phenylpropionate dioxygenase-like ring-hydroxylating dioxygenase large terminal subunit